MAESPLTSHGEYRVIGLDPGSRCTGYGLVAERSGVASLLEAGTIRPGREDALSDRLGRIFSRLTEIIAEHAPLEAAVEDVFVSRNSSSALKLGQARGAALVACSYMGLPAHTYEPSVIKKNLVGQGRANKDQVAFMVQRILGVSGTHWSRDCSDALAAAVSHLNARRFTARMSRAGNS